MTDQTPDPFEDTLAESLQTRWPERAATDRQVQALLAQLTPQRKPIMPTRLSSALRSAAFIGALAFLVIALSWIFGSIPVSPAVEQPTPTGGENPSETPTPPGAATPEEPQPPATQLPTLPASGFSSLPGVTFSFASPLPTSPAALTLYRQQLGDALTEDAVREMANQMGLAGDVTSYPGEGGDVIYNVTDGDAQMVFFGFPDQFSYFINTSAPHADPLPFKERVAIAEDFLSAHGLLTFPYRTEESTSDPHGVRFVQVMDHLALSYGIGETPGLIEWITVSVDAERRVHSLFHSPHNFQPVTSLPLLTAEQAWARLSGPNAALRNQYAVLAPPSVWTRAAAEPAETITGYLNNENGGTTFYADDGRILTLADIPADMPQYASLEIHGTVAGDVLAWTEMTLLYNTYGASNSYCGGGGGGGYFVNPSFGGGSFATVTLDPDDPGPQNEYVSPIQPGDVVEGVQGTLYIIRHIRTDGSEENLYTFWFAGDETTEGWTATLEGEALAGTVELMNLPIKVWGTVAALDATGQAVITVERYEEAYPGTRIEAWLGTQQLVTLEGREVVILTAQDGNPYVLNDSIEWGADGGLMGLPGDTVLIEGYVLADKTFGGYPVIHMLSGSPETGRTSLDDYVIQANQPSINDDREYPEYPDPALTAAGHVTIENVELMYSASTLTDCYQLFLTNPDFSPFLYVQPIWRFSGHFEDGRLFEVQVQALPDEYLR